MSRFRVGRKPERNARSRDGRWPVLPARTNAAAQAGDAMRALQAAASAFADVERARGPDDVILQRADDVIRCRLQLYGLYVRLGMRPASGLDNDLWRDSALLRWRLPGLSSVSSHAAGV